MRSPDHSAAVGITWLYDSDEKILALVKHKMLELLG